MRLNRVSQTESKKQSVRTEPDQFRSSPKKTSTVRKPPVATKDAKTLAKKGVQIILEQNQMYSGEKEKSRYSKTESERKAPLRSSLKADLEYQPAPSQVRSSYNRNVNTMCCTAQTSGCCCLNGKANSRCSFVSNCGNNQLYNCLSASPRVSINNVCSHRSIVQPMNPGCNFMPAPNPYVIQPNVYVAPPQPYQMYYPHSFSVYNQPHVVYSPPYILSPRNGSFVESTAFGAGYNQPHVVYANGYEDELIYGRPVNRDRRSMRNSRAYTENDAGVSNNAKRSQRETEKQRVIKEIEKAKKLLKELKKEKSVMKSVVSAAQSIMPTTSIHEIAHSKNFKSEIDEMIVKLQNLEIKNKVNSALQQKTQSELKESRVPFPEMPNTRPSFMIGNLDRFVQDERQSTTSNSRSKFNFASEIDSISRIKLARQIHSQQDPSPVYQFEGSKFDFHKKPSQVYDEQSKVLSSERFIMIGNNLPVYIETMDPKKDEFVSQNQDTRSQETEERYKKLKKTLFVDRTDSKASNPFLNI